MKLLFENWRQFLTEKKWEDFDHPKGQWADVSPDDIKSSQDPINVDLSDELFDLIDNAYEEIGGHFDFQNSGDLPADHDDWLALDWDEDPEPDALRIGRHKPAGIKMTGAGHDGKSQSKRAYIEKTLELLKSPGYYAEMSKAIAHIMITRYKAPVVVDEATVRKVLGKEITWIGPHPEGKYPGFDGWYEREIGGEHLHMKIMLGKPK